MFMSATLRSLASGHAMDSRMQTTNDPGPLVMVAGERAVALVEVDANGDRMENNGPFLQITDVSIENGGRWRMSQWPIGPWHVTDESVPGLRWFMVARAPRGGAHVARYRCAGAHGNSLNSLAIEFIRARGALARVRARRSTRRRSRPCLRHAGDWSLSAQRPNAVRTAH